MIKKFEGTLGGEDYDLIKLVVEHHDEFQAMVGVAVQEFAEQNTEQNTIKVVEVGVGTGLTTKDLLGADPRVRVIGIDNEPTMLEVAKGHFPSRVEFVLDDAIAALGRMPDGSVDVVASCYCIHNLDENFRSSIFKEIFRVLRSGGLIVNGDKIAVDDEEDHSAMLKKQLDKLPLFDAIGRPDLQEEWDAHYQADDHIRFTEREQRQLLVEAGFEEIQITYRKEMEAVFVAKKF